jgi:Fe-S cluster assembly iron-binding protein IscA
MFKRAFLLYPAVHAGRVRKERLMIEVTQGATALLNKVRAAKGIPNSYGLRFYQETAGDGEAAVGIAFAEAPGENDQVITEQDVPVYIAPEVAPELGNAVLDVEGEPTPQRFVIRAP